MTEKTPRDALLDRVNMGELTPAQAEAEAKRLGMAPLQPPDPNPELFDPTREAQWTLPMAVAWIAHREISAVRNRWETYRSEFWIWHERRFSDGPSGSMRSGWVLGRRGKTTMAAVTLATNAEATKERNPRFSMSPTEAIKALWEALQSDCFRATGIDQKSWARVEILPESWFDLRCFEQAGEDEVRPEASHLGGYPRYHEVLLPSRAIRGLWGESHVVEPLRLPPIVPPTGHGYMPLYCAAQWIAADGGSRDLDPTDTASWTAAFEELLGAITTNRVDVVGTNRGQATPVPSNLFVGIRIEYPFSESSLDLILSDDLILRSSPYVGDEQWRKGFDDALIDRHGDHWRRLMVRKDDVRELWPFQQVDGGLDQRTGMPGRPAKSKHLIEDEFRRRADAGRLAGTLADEAGQLLGWLVDTYPTLPRPTQTTVENNIRTEYRRLKPTE